MATSPSLVVLATALACGAVLTRMLVVNKRRGDNKPQSNPEKVPVGIGVVVTRDGSVLVGRRKSKQGHNQWALPGGWLEPHETFVECALRELEEETGFSAKEDVVRGSARVMKEIAPAHNGFSVSLFASVELRPGSDKSPTLMEPDKCFEWRFLPLPPGEGEVVRWPEEVKNNLFPSLKHFLLERRALTTQ